MNLVNELQVSAEQDDVLTVLRKTKRLASKLGRQDISSWLQCEQNGYFDDSIPLPEYRRITGILAYNTNGYIPAGYGMLKSGVVDVPLGCNDLPCELRDSISDIQSLIAQAKESGHQIVRTIPDGSPLDELIRNRFPVNPMFANQISFLLRLNTAQLRSIPEQIKDKVLDWACALENAGVTGEGMSFNDSERQAAHSVTFNIYDSHIEQLTNSGMNKKGG